MQSPPSRIGFIGIGIMGSRMAARLVRAGLKVAIWNRSTEKCRLLADLGATVAPSAAATAKDAEFVITMLADGDSVGNVLFDLGLAKALAKGAIVVDMSSIPPPTARDHARRLGALGLDHLDAPVSGGPGGAEEGRLAIMAGGDALVFDRALPVLEHLGRPVLVGPAGSGQLAKLANQVIVALTIGAVAEALLLAASGGANPAKVREALSGGFADSLILKVHGQRMLDRSFAPGGPSRLQLKDLDTILAAAKEAGLDLPLAGHVAELFRSLVARGGGGLDHSALLLEIERMNTPNRLGSQPDRLPVGVKLD